MKSFQKSQKSKWHGVASRDQAADSWRQKRIIGGTEESTLPGKSKEKSFFKKTWDAFALTDWCGIFASALIQNCSDRTGNTTGPPPKVEERQERKQVRLKPRKTICCLMSSFSQWVKLHRNPKLDIITFSMQWKEPTSTAAQSVANRDTAAFIDRCTQTY